jgi:pyrroline-5-carboxylate reductase
MIDVKVGFVGGGRVARIVLGGWSRSRHWPGEVVVSDVDQAGLQRLQAEFPRILCTEDNRRAAAQQVVLFALHPPAFPAVLAEIATSLQSRAIFVSLAPKWTTSRLCEALGGFDRIARVIPNAPSIVNAGHNPVAFSPRLADDDRARVRSLFAPLGSSPEVPEDVLEAYAIVAAMGPTYLWPQLYQLVELGRQFGMTEQAAMDAVVAMAYGSTKTMSESGLTPEGVMDLIPVKPLAAFEPVLRQTYTETLGALHRKLMP